VVCGTRPLDIRREALVADDPIVTSFGTSGKRTVRRNKRAVILESDELLVYTLIARGSTPAFGFACRHEPILSADTIEGPRPREKYVWEYTPHVADDVLQLLLSFVGILKYSVRIDRLTTDGALVEVVRDVDYESEDPEDTAEDRLTVLQSA
jgi:hypothetical protein